MFLLFYLLILLINKILFQYQWIKYKYVKTEDELFEFLIIPCWDYLEDLTYSPSNVSISGFFSINFQTSNSFNLPTSSFFNKYSYFNHELDFLKIPLLLNNDEMRSCNFLTEYFYLRKLTFINFFINNMIDVPICFKKSKSLRFRNFELPILKFSNFLMRSGKREKINRIVFLSLRFLLLPSISDSSDKLEESGYWAWPLMYLSFYNSMVNFYYNTRYDCIFDQSLKLDTYSLNLINYSGRSSNTDSFLKSYILKHLSQVLPVFNYFIYSVDKNIRKFSRGKSGKYTFIWKYVSSYKRLYLAMRLIVKDIKFLQSKKISQRISKTIENLKNNLNKSLVWRSKVFSHNYVFKNFRKTLMTSLKTTS